VAYPAEYKTDISQSKTDISQSKTDISQSKPDGVTYLAEACEQRERRGSAGVIGHLCLHPSL
jgi:hypothetical protein